MRNILTLMATLLWSACMHAQMGKLFDVDKLISSSFINQIYIDRDGFIWAATRNGLNRYDGYQIRIFKKEQDKQLGMASNYVNCLMQDRQGMFYVGMYGALQRYDGQQFHTIQTFTLSGQQSPAYITCLLQRAGGDILVGTSGLGVLRLTSPDEAHQLGGALGGVSNVNAVMEDSRQRLWIATQDQGLLCYDGSTAVSYFTAEESRSTVMEVCEDHQGNIYAGTTNAGLFRIGPDGPEHIAQTGGKQVSALYVNRQGNIMLGYDGQGVAVYNPLSGTLDDNPYFSPEVDLTTTKVYSICEDENGNVWLGLLQKGIFMQPGNTVDFHYMGYKLGARNVIGTACVTSVMEDGSGRRWVGTDKDGLYCLDRDMAVVRHFKEHFPSTILGLAEDSLGRVWIGSYKEGCGWIDGRTLDYHPMPLPQGPHLSVFDLVTAPDGRIWMGTMGQGLLCYDGTTGKVKQYLMADEAPTDRHVNSICNNYISQVALSPDGGTIYAATSMGVSAMVISTESWLTTFNGLNTPNYGISVRIARKYGQKLRIGTNDGLYCYDFLTHQLERHGQEDGMADNSILSIEEDHQHNLWIATGHGLCRVDTQTQAVSSYFVDNGLQSNEFSDGASWVCRDGTLVFGGPGGLTWFDPADIQEREWKAEVKLTGLTAGGEDVTTATMSGLWRITDVPVIASNRFVLSSSDNTFSFQLSTLTYDNPEHIVYRYRINREPWVRLQPGANEMTFSHMSPGNYDFCVVAEQNGIATPERCFTVVIHAPWYRTPLAYAVYLLAVVALLWWFWWQSRRRQQNRLRLQEHIHASELADAKLKFFMNISHEIRTPMTLIVTPLLSLIKQDADPHRRSVYETMRRNAERILGLINQMMDLRKIDKGQMQMHMRETELVGFISDIYEMFSGQARNKNIQYTYSHDAQELPAWIDRNNFDKVVVNLLSNAFKFTPTGGTVVLSLTHDAQQATISVRDNGEGIPADKIERVFERFYQAPAHLDERNMGTGIGLDLTRSLVELHHGSITVANNTDGKGCQFTVTIPLGNGHLKPEEMVTPDEPAAADTSLVADEAPEEPQATSQPPKLPKVGNRQRIVIVEDDSEILEFLRNEFSADYDVTTCVNGRQGLSEVVRTLPDLVVSDVMMPEMDGTTLCSKIKANPATSHIPVVLLTAKSRDEDHIEGLAMGADAYIMKPFNMDILRRTIVNLIYSHQLLSLKYGRNDQLEELVDQVQMKSPDEQLLERIMKVINSNLSNSDLSVDFIADKVGISRVHLHRKMKELTGQTPHDFIRNLRLKQAAHLLAGKNMNVTEVMYACGFNNAASFSTIFKKLYGMSPREFMNEHRT